VDAALALISEGELGTFSLREVARRAGVTPAAPYHHFKDKTALLAAVAEEGFMALCGRLEAALAHVPAARLVAAPDCGMKYLPRGLARAKLQALAAGAALISRGA